MKNKYIIITLCLFTAIAGSAQKNYKGKDGRIRFFSVAPLENIEAENEMASSVFDELNNKVAVLIPIKSFVFKKTLMQEHFNENYLESDKYPNATFIGKVVGVKSFKEMPMQTLDISGTLTIHGVSRERDIKTTLTLNSDGTLSAKGSFKVKLEDHNIKIPRLLFQNIAETIDVTFDLQLK